MYNDNHYYSEVKADKLGEDIEKQFDRYGVKIEIKNSVLRKDRVIFKIKLKGATREPQLFARASDVQLKLKLPLFQLFKDDFTIFIVASELKIKYSNLLRILNNSAYVAFKKKNNMELPCIVGHSIIGTPVILDLALENHILMGGSSGSGKSVALQCLILNMVIDKSTAKVNLLIIDAGANDLMICNGIPHLSCPVIRDAIRGLQALQCLKDEMEKRINMEITNNDEFKLLPRIICIIDEFPALISGINDKQKLKQLTEAISSLLQRGRHAKIHVVLAAQNPTIKNMKIDLGNITTRMAFTCAKRNFSETILGESGAEHLSGKGDMYLKSPKFDGVQRIQGMFISPGDLKQALVPLKLKPVFNRNKEHMFVVSEMDLYEDEFEDNDDVREKSNATIETNVDNALLSKILLWALERQFVSCNKIIQAFKIGWPRADNFLEKLHEFGIAGNVYKKLPRTILPQCVEDIPDEVMNFLSKNGVSINDITTAIRKREHND